MSGLFVVIEGPDGIGKTTLSRRLLAGVAETLHHKVTLQAFPSDNCVGKLIRQVLRREVVLPEPNAYGLAHLFEADRALCKADIERRLAAGEIVICDRYDMSTVVYQYLLNDLPVQLMRGRRVPDLTLVLDLRDPQALLARMHARSSTRELFEADETLARMIELYDRAAWEMSSTDHIVRVAAEHSADEVYEVAVGAIASRMMSLSEG